MYDAAIIDYKTSNLNSVISACKLADIRYVITTDLEMIKNSKALIIPGVGSFKSAMNYLKKKKIDKIIIDFYKQNKPILGICLGMQIFFSLSEESKNVTGIGIIKKPVKRFHLLNAKKVPLIGWNKVYGKLNSNLFKNKKDLNYYFVHSYHVNYFKKKNFKVFYSLNGKTKFCSYLEYKNLFLMQFHPEKSGKKGIEIYRNFKKIINLN